MSNLKSIRATWTLIYAQDELQAKRAPAPASAPASCRWCASASCIDEGFDPCPYVEALRKALKASEFPPT